MKYDKLSKTDELLLLNDFVGARKNLLKQVRRVRTHAKNTIRSLDVSDMQWPNEGQTERKIIYQACKEYIAKCDAMEKTLLHDLATD